MRKNLILQVFLFLILLNCSAQETIVFNKLSNTAFNSQHTRFTAYDIFEAPIATINNLVNHEDNSLSHLVLDLGNGKKFDISLLADNLLTANYKTVVASEQVRQELTIDKCITYQGKLFTDTNSQVALTITNDFFYGLIRTEGKEYYFEPLSFFQNGLDANKVIFYEKSDVILDPNLRCAANEPSGNYNTHRNITAGTSCLIAEIAIASDESMFTRYGSAVAVQNHNIGVLNNVKVDYLNNSFNDNIEFKLFTQYVSTAAANDPLTPAYSLNVSNTVLTNFAAWAEGNGTTGGFGSVLAYDIGSFWTTRDLDNNGVIGLAYVGGYCTTAQYQILEDFTGSNPTGSGFQLRVLQSHETGHNFNMSHDAAGTPNIMAPSVQNTSTWSAASISSMNAFLPTRSACNNTCVVGLPVTEFANTNSVCVGTALQFTDFTYGGPTTWSWTFQDGTPATSTTRNPSITFSTTGVKAVTLTATNTNGSVSKTKNILVEAAATSACAVSGTNTTDGGIRGFTLEQISNTTPLPAGQAGTVYNNYSCTKIASLTASTAYSGTVTVGTTTPANAFNHQDIYIDYNNDGDFIDANEQVFTSGGTANIGTVTFNFTTPAAGAITQNKHLRLRMVARTSGEATTSCPAVAAMSGAEVEDYAVIFPVILPFNDLVFNGILTDQRKALLNWKVQAGNNALVVLEKSKDGVNFMDINNSSVFGSTTNYTDAETVNGTVYYRLRVIQRTSNVYYSNIIRLQSGNKQSLVQTIYPNPFDNSISYSLFLKNSSTVTFKIIDMSGKIVYTSQERMATGFQTGSLKHLNHLSKGTYMLHITNGDEVVTKKIVK